MLVLGIKPSESFRIGQDITVHILNIDSVTPENDYSVSEIEIRNKKTGKLVKVEDLIVRVGIDAPKSIPIIRQELLSKKHAKSYNS